MSMTLLRRGSLLCWDENSDSKETKKGPLNLPLHIPYYSCARFVKVPGLRTIDKSFIATVHLDQGASERETMVVIETFREQETADNGDFWHYRICDTWMKWYWGIAIVNTLFQTRTRLMIDVIDWNKAIHAMQYTQQYYQYQYQLHTNSNPRRYTSRHWTVVSMKRNSHFHILSTTFSDFFLHSLHS